MSIYVSYVLTMQSQCKRYLQLNQLNMFLTQPSAARSGPTYKPELEGVMDGHAIIANLAARD